ncbi:hypothetical protein RI367_003896 [Sorochytrium milnesiophthora]
MRKTWTLLTLLAVCALVVPGLALPGRSTGVTPVSNDGDSSYDSKPDAAPEGMVREAAPKETSEIQAAKKGLPVVEMTIKSSMKYLDAIYRDLDTNLEPFRDETQKAYPKFWSGVMTARKKAQDDRDSLVQNTSTLSDETLTLAFWRQETGIRHALIREVNAASFTMENGRDGFHFLPAWPVVYRIFEDWAAKEIGYCLENGGDVETCQLEKGKYLPPLQYESGTSILTLIWSNHERLTHCEVADMPKAELQLTSPTGDSNPQCSVIVGHSSHGTIAGPGWDPKRCDDNGSNQDRSSGKATSYSGLSFQKSRPVWIIQDQVCVLATARGELQYDFQYTLPHLNSPEKCITDATTQPRNATHQLTWNGEQCILFQDQNGVPTANYILDGAKQDACCDAGDCQSAIAKEAASAKDIEVHAGWIHWQNGQFCSFAAIGLDELGYIPGVTRDQCQRLLQAPSQQPL